MAVFLPSEDGEWINGQTNLHRWRTDDAVIKPATHANDSAAKDDVVHAPRDNGLTVGIVEHPPLTKIWIALLPRCSIIALWRRKSPTIS